jgi:hypothetical protein
MHACALRSEVRRDGQREYIRVHQSPRDPHVSRATQGFDIGVTPGSMRLARASCDGFHTHDGMSTRSEGAQKTAGNLRFSNTRVRTGYE